MLTYDLSDRGDASLYEFLYASIRDDIASGALAADAKLPSKRQFARHLGVSVITVENAYAQLIAEGYVRSQERRGFFVNPIAAPLSEPAPTPPPSVTESQAVPPAALLGDLASNAMPAGIFPFSAWARAMRAVLSSATEDQLAAQSHRFGSPALRREIAAYLHDYRGMVVDPRAIVVGAGAQVLYNLLIQLLGREAHYAVEDPGYPRLTRIYAANDVRLSHIPIDDGGIRADLLADSGAHIAHVMPSHQYPTGIVTSIGRRYDLLAWAASEHGRFIIEDDYDVEFRLAGRPIPSMFSADTGDNVIYINTFSKSLGTIFRVGFMVLPPRLADEFDNRMDFYSSTVSTIEQLTLARFIHSGAYERHVNRLRKRYRTIRDSLISALEGSSLASVMTIRGQDAGLHFQLTLDLPVSGAEFAAPALEAGVRLAPMSRFHRMSAHPASAPSFVVSYGALDESRIDDVVRALEAVASAIKA